MNLQNYHRTSGDRLSRVARFVWPRYITHRRLLTKRLLPASLSSIARLLEVSLEIFSFQIMKTNFKTQLLYRSPFTPLTMAKASKQTV